MFHIPTYSLKIQISNKSPTRRRLSTESLNLIGYRLIYSNNKTNSTLLKLMTFSMSFVSKTETTNVRISVLFNIYLILCNYIIINHFNVSAIKLSIIVINIQLQLNDFYLLIKIRIIRSNLLIYILDSERSHEYIDLTMIRVICVSIYT